MYTATIVQENHSRTMQIIQETNHHITQVIEEDRQNKEIHKIRHKITTIDQIVEITTPDLIQTQHSLFLDLIPNQEIDTIQTINHETHHIIEIETTLIIEIEVIQTIEISIIQTTDQEITHTTEQTVIIKIDREIIHKIHIQVIIIVIEIIPNHHTGIIITTIILIIATEVVHLNIKDISTKYNLIQKQHQTPPGIDDTVTDTLQLNQINCGSSDSESDTENTLSINMIKVENDYEPVIYEQPFSSHIYENQSEFLQNYYTKPIHSTPTTQETNGINTTNQPNENVKTKCLNTNHIYQNIQKEQPKEKI